jgi:methylation protein EvaC
MTQQITGKFLKNSIEFLDLGLQPLANDYQKKSQKKKEKKYKLKILFDKKTKLVSIKDTFSSKMMFNNKYPYRSSMSSTMLNSFKKLSFEIKKNYNPKKILEIGSNDGSFLRNFRKDVTIGVEPCSNIEKITRKAGFDTYADYWDKKLAKKLVKKYKNVDLIYSANTITHIKNLDQVFKSILLILSKNGKLIIEDPSLLNCLKNNTYDQFYNEHIYVFSLIALENIISKYNLEVFKIQNLNVHGGSTRYFIKRKSSKIKIDNSVKNQRTKEIKFGLDKIKTYTSFAKRVIDNKKRLIMIFNNLKSKNKKIIGYGATAKSTTILNYCNIKNNYIDYFLDTTKDKQNKLLPGTKIPINKYQRGIPIEVDYVFLGAWNFKKEIFKKEKKFLSNGGKFIIHTPTPRII